MTTHLYTAYIRSFHQLTEVEKAGGHIIKAGQLFIDFHATEEQVKMLSFTPRKIS